MSLTSENKHLQITVVTLWPWLV